MIRIGLVDDDKEHQKLIRQFICRYEKEDLCERIYRWTSVFRRV